MRWNRTQTLTLARLHSHRFTAAKVLPPSQPYKLVLFSDEAQAEVSPANVLAGQQRISQVDGHKAMDTAGFTHRVCVYRAAFRFTG